MRMMAGRFRRTLLVLAVAAGMLGAASRGARAEGLAIVGATVVDGAAAPIPDAVVLIKGDRIQAVGSRAQVALPKGITIVDGRGKWVAPGLVDAHVHFFQSGGAYTRPHVLDRRELERKPDLMKVWFVVRSLGNESLARSSNRGALRTPQTPPASDDLAAGKALVAATVDEARKGGVRTAVHAAELETARAAVEAGADVLVHSVFDKPVDDAFVELLKRRGVVYIPTLFVRTGYTLVLTGSFTPTPAERRWADPDVLATFEEVKGRPELTSRPRRAA